MAILGYFRLVIINELTSDHRYCNEPTWVVNEKNKYPFYSSLRKVGMLHFHTSFLYYLTKGPWFCRYVPTTPIRVNFDSPTVSYVNVLILKCFNNSVTGLGKFS